MPSNPTPRVAPAWLTEGGTAAILQRYAGRHSAHLVHVSRVTASTVVVAYADGETRRFSLPRADNPIHSRQGADATLSLVPLDDPHATALFHHQHRAHTQRLLERALRSFDGSDEAVLDTLYAKIKDAARGANKHP